MPERADLTRIKPPRTVRVASDRFLRRQLAEIAQRVRDGRLQVNIGATPTLEEAVAVFTSTERSKGKTVVVVRP